MFKTGDRVRYDQPTQCGTVVFADESIFEVEPDPGGKGGMRRFLQDRRGKYMARRALEYPVKI